MGIVRITSDCIDCLTKGHLEKHPEGISEELKLEYKRRVLQILGNCDLSSNAPFLTREIDHLRKEMFGKTVDYTEIKQYFNGYVMKKTDRIEKEIEAAEDKLLRGLQYAMTGNYIDFGTMQSVAEDKFEELLDAAKDIPLDKEQFENLRTDLETAKKLVFLHDNCGEIVFDHMLIKTLKNLYPDLQIISMVRGYPVINDATMDDAVQIGLTETVQVMGNGSDIAGTMFEYISEEALHEIKTADLVIAKGQGNFETLYGCGLNIYYLFMCKCKMFANRFKKNIFEGMLLNDKTV